MDTMHPVMRQALAPILPPGFRSAPAVATVDALHAHIAHMERKIDAQEVTIKTLLAQIEGKDCKIARLESEASKRRAPTPQRGYSESTYDHPELGELVIHYEIEQESPPYQHCGALPACVSVVNAYPLEAKNIGDRLSDDECAAIATAIEKELSDSAP